MTEYRVAWCACPHVHNQKSVLYVNAENADDAKTIAKDHIERTFGISWFSIFEATPTKPLPAGSVVT